MESQEENQSAETLSPTVDLIDEHLFEDDDDVNDGVPVPESKATSGEGGASGAEQGITENDDYSLNYAYINHLTELRRVIKLEIQRCKEKQDNITKRIKDLESQPINPVARKNWYHLFGYPYFKDRYFFPAPINEDQRMKLSRREIDYHRLQPIRRWTESDCLKLEVAVKANAIEKRTSGLMTQRGQVVEELKDPCLPAKKKAELNDKLKGIELSIEKVKKMDAKTLYGAIDTQFDWLKIAAEAFGEVRSSEEVQAMWVLCRHPSINRRHWTRSENEALVTIAKRHKEQSWDRIAFELNTNRSEFQCVIQYQRKLNSDFINHRWTEEEDQMLMFLVERCRVNDYIPWATIAMCMKNRTRNQVYNRWMYAINPEIKRGRFTEKEDCLILAGVKHFGTDYARIAELLPGRTSAQVYARYTLSLSRDGPLGQWSAEEDLKLLKTVELHGRDWTRLAQEHFTSRSRSQLRHRYRYLEDWLRKNPDSSVSMAPRRDLGDNRRRNSNLWSTIQRALATSDKKRKDKEITTEDMELLQVAMASYEKIRKPRAVGRKRKIFSRSDKLLNQVLKPCYILSTGRVKAMYTEEELQKRENITLKLLNIVKACLAFPFDESVIQDDPVLCVADENILLRMKENYDQRNTDSFGQGSSVSTSSVPLYVPQEKINTDLPEGFPCFIKNTVGLRTVLLSRTNLRMWKVKDADSSVALPAMRPTSDAFQGVQTFSGEECAKLFAERMFSIFYWPTLLGRVVPEFDDKSFLQPDSSVNGSPTSDPSPSRKRKRTMKDVARSKKILMREKWKKFREDKAKAKAKAKNGSDPGRSPYKSAAAPRSVAASRSTTESKSAALSRKRKLELELI